MNRTIVAFRNATEESLRDLTVSLQAYLLGQVPIAVRTQLFDAIQTGKTSDRWSTYSLIVSGLWESDPASMPTALIALRDALRNTNGATVRRLALAAAEVAMETGTLDVFDRMTR